MPREGGLYYDWIEFPIKEISVEALEKYQWPQLDPLETVGQLRDQARHLFENTDYALVGSDSIGGGIFEQACRIVGLENFMISMVTNRPFADRLLERITDIYIESVDRYLDLVGEYIQVFAFCDDVSTQSGWMISPDLYKSLVKPRHRRLFEAIRRRTQAKLLYHCCGAASELFPHLIDIGVDIVNPVQVSASGMDSKKLKERFGRDLVFWGGGVDTQRILPFGTVQDVRDEVRRRIDDLAPGGGFVFAAVHNIQAFVPPENIVAVYDTAIEHGQYGC